MLYERGNKLKKKILISLTVSILLLTSFLAIIQVSAAGESWPTFQHDYLRTGVADNTGPKTNTLVWKWYSGITMDYGEAIPESTALVAAVVDGKVFVGTEENRFVALDEFTGDLIWEFDTQGIVRTPPSVADGKVFFGSHDGNFYALDANTGDLEWKYGPIDSGEFDVGIWTIGTVVANGLVIFGAEDVYALDVDNGDLVWRQDFSGGYDWALGAASDGNLVLVPSLDAKLYALDLTTGDEVWSYETDSYIESVPAIGYGNVYVGSTDNQTYAIDLNTGELVWKIEHGWSDLWGFGGGGWSHPALHNNRVVTAGTDGLLLSLDSQTGDIIWTFNTGNLTFGGVAIVDGVIYGGTYNNQFYAIDEANGELIWEYVTDGPINGGPAIVDGMMIWGSSDGYLYAIGEPVLPSEGIPVEYIYAGVAVVAIIIIAVAVVVLKKKS